MPDKRLEKCLKPVLDLNATHISVSDDHDDSINNSTATQSIVELCTVLPEKVRVLEETILVQNNRISELEKQSTISKMDSIIKTAKKTSRGTTMDQAEGCVHGEPNKEAEPGTHRTQSQSGDVGANTFLPGALPKTKPRDVAEGVVHRKCKTLNPGPLGTTPQPATFQPDVSKSNRNPTSPQGRENDGFRYSSYERKNILRGTRGLRAATSQRDIRGSSTGAHKISAVSESIDGPFLIYVGKLAACTTSTLLREHLVENNINDIADVICLNNRYGKTESSFCISVNSQESMNIAFKPRCWPTGVVVRPFRPSRRQPRPQRSLSQQWRREEPIDFPFSDSRFDRDNSSKTWFQRNRDYLGPRPRFESNMRRY